MMGYVYFILFLSTFHLIESLIITVLFLSVIIGFGTLGYIINDYFDTEQDHLSGKLQSFVNLNTSQKIVGLTLAFSLTTLPWLVLPLNLFNVSFLALQIILYFLYSHPFVRLKEKHIFGILSDALYGHLLPALIIVFTFRESISELKGNTLIIAFAFIFWNLLKGSRNILLHQIDDRKNDLKSGIKTFILKIGPVSSLNLINRYILPLEIITLIIWVYEISLTINWFCTGFIIFLLFTILKFSAWKFPFIPKRQLKFKFLYVLNDLYEEWLPILILICWTATELDVSILLGLHLLLFNGILIKFWKDLRTIKTNISYPEIAEF